MSGGGRSRQQVYGPANAPIFDPDGIRDRRRFLTLTELPPFSVQGFVDDVGVSPGYAPPLPVNILEVCVTVGGGGGPVDLLVRRTGPSGADSVSITVSTSGVHLFYAGDGGIPLTRLDRVFVEITDFGDGTLENLCVIPRLVRAP